MISKKPDRVVVNIKNRSLLFAPETENETFGKFILQTNEVQVTLAIAVFLQSSFPDKKYSEFLFERAELGTLVNMFHACAEKTTEMRGLLSALKEYNKNRIKIAHKMYLSEKRLNQKDADRTIKKGKDILETLDKLIKKYKLMLALIKR